MTKSESYSIIGAKLKLPSYLTLQVHSPDEV